MDDILFKDKNEKEAFESLLASRQYKILNNYCDGLNHNIKDFLNLCDEILKENNARCNFIAEIFVRQNKSLLPKSSDMPSEKDNPKLKAEINSLEKEFQEYLYTAPLTVREDLEFYYGRIKDRFERLNKQTEEINNLLEIYPNIKNLNQAETIEKLSTMFNNIEQFLPVVKAEKELEPIIEEELEEPIIGLIEPIYDNPFNNDIEEEFEDESLAADLVSDFKEEKQTQRFEVIGIKTFEPEKEIIKEEFKELDIEIPESIPELEEEKIVDAKPDFDSLDFKVLSQELEQEEEMDTIFNTHITDTNFSLEDLEPTYEESATTVDVPKEAPEPELDSLMTVEAAEEMYDKSEDFISFEIPDDVSLSDIAIALCGDVNGWYDIYQVNKDLFEKIIVKYNGGSVDGIEQDNKLFGGLTINIPTVFTKEKNEPSLKL